jgi:thioredoxin-like negative regulator of GroEL
MMAYRHRQENLGMEVAIRQSRSLTVGIASACLLLAAIYAWCAGREYQASRLSSSLDLPSLERAIALEPHDATRQDLLCRFLLFDMQDAPAAIAPCRRATELNPYQSEYWLHLALAYYRSGAEQQQQEAILNAVSVDPTTPDVAWEAANFFLVQGKTPEALHQFSVVMRGDPTMVRRSLELCWRALHDVDALQSTLPPNPEVYLQLIRLLIEKNEWAAAHQIWTALLQLNQEFDYRHALFYVDALLQKQDVAAADEVWKQLAARSPALSHYLQPGNLIVNGDFAEDILNDGFDWHYTAQPGIAVSVDTTQSHSGNQSLSIAFSNSGGDAGLYQYVPVKPNTDYTFSAWARSEELRSANGPYLSITGAYDNSQYAVTKDTVGTTPWHLLETSFRTGPATWLVAVRVVRDPGNTRILGQFWLDEVALRPSAKVPQPS